MRMIAKLDDLGIKIEWQRVQRLAQDGSVGRPHIAQALLEAGYVGSVREAFDKYIGRNGPAYAEREKMTPVESVKMITDVRGLPVLAHPANIDDLDNLMPDLVKAGLVGIEVFYTKYTPEMISILLTIANHYNLITTGGTDYHHFGDGVEDIIGSVLAPPNSVKQLFSLADKSNLGLTKRHSL
jgi:predicted metal-dependent phosphoesterase TrpH